MFLQLLTFATPALAQGNDYGLTVTAGAADLVQYGNSLPSLIGNALGAVLSLVGVLFFALMLYGGVTWMLAHGNAEQEKKALNTIMAAIIGILIVLGSYALTTFVFDAIKGTGGGNNSNTQPQQKSCVADEVGDNPCNDLCATKPPVVTCGVETWCSQVCKLENNTCVLKSSDSLSKYCGQLSGNTCENDVLCKLK